MKFSAEPSGGFPGDRRSRFAKLHLHVEVAETRERPRQLRRSFPDLGGFVHAQPDRQVERHQQSAPLDPQLMHLLLPGMASASLQPSPECAPRSLHRCRDKSCPVRAVWNFGGVAFPSADGPRSDGAHLRNLFISQNGRRGGSASGSSASRAMRQSPVDDGRFVSQVPGIPSAPKSPAVEPLPILK
jgi:hypothetical protein